MIGIKIEKVFEEAFLAIQKKQVKFLYSNIVFIFEYYKPLFQKKKY